MNITADTYAPLIYLDTGNVLSAKSGGTVQLSAWSNSDDQRWSFNDKGNGWYEIHNKGNGHVLDSGTVGLCTQPSRGTMSQLWLVRPIDDSRFVLIQAGSGLAIEGTSLSRFSGGLRQQWAVSMPALIIRLVTTHAIYTDAGSGADLSVAIYEPDFPDEPGWGFFGHQAVRLPEGRFGPDDTLVKEHAPYAFIVKQASASNGALCHAASLDRGSMLWTDQHSGGDQNIEIYAPVPDTNGYRSLGVFAAVVDSYGDDPMQSKKIKQAFDRLVFVKPELVAEGKYLNATLTWTDAGAGANGHGKWNDIALWRPSLDPVTGLSPQTFIASPTYQMLSKYVGSGAAKGQPTPAPLYLAWSGMRLDHTGLKSHWMAQTPEIHSKKLRTICLPATHDTGTYSLRPVFGEDPDNSKGKQGGENFLNKIHDIAEKIEGVPGIGRFIPNPFDWIAGKVFPAILGMATAQSRSILQQLFDGIRGFDLRVYQYGNTYCVGHGGVLGGELDGMFQAILYFLRMTHGEIVFVTMGHWTNFVADDYTKFRRRVVQILGDYAYCRAAGDVLYNDPFDKTYYEIVAPNGSAPQSKVILVWDMAADDWKKYMTDEGDDLKFWPASFSPPSSGIGLPGDVPTSRPANWDPENGWPTLAWLKSAGAGVFGQYTDTEEPQTVFAQQGFFHDVVVHAEVPHPPALALYMTVTPSGESTGVRVAVKAAKAIALFAPLALIIPGWGEGITVALEVLAASLAIADATLKWHTLRELAARMGEEFKEKRDQLFSRPGQENVISLLYGDFYQDSGLVDFAIQLSTQCVASIDTTFRQTTQPQEGWQAVDFHDAGWSLPVDEGPSGQAGGGWENMPMPAGSNARWMWNHDSRNAADTNTVYFRKRFTPAHSSGVLYIAADDTFTVYLNGDLLGRGSYGKTYTFPLPLHAGALNVIAAKVVNTGGRGGLLTEIVYPDSTSSPEMQSDTSFLQSTTAWPDGWQNVDFSDASWQPAVDEGPNGQDVGGWQQMPMPAGSKARWIWNHDSRNAFDTNTVYFRKRFTPAQRSGTLHIAADDEFEVYLNGKSVGTGKYGQVYTFSLHFNAGAFHVIAAKVVNTGGRGGLLTEIVYPPDPALLPDVRTDNTFLQTLDPAEGWQNVDFSDASWQPVVDEGPYGTAPWPAVNMLGMPLNTKAHWIWNHDSLTQTSWDTNTVYFRKRFTPARGAAILYITADHEYTVYVNGVEVGSGNDWSHVNAYFVSLNVGSINVIAVKVVNQGMQGGLIAELVYVEADRLSPGLGLLPGFKLTSKNGAYELRYQQDGNLVLYRTKDSYVMFATGTQDQQAGCADITDNGNFIVSRSRAASTAIWAAKVAGSGRVGVFGTVFENDQSISSLPSPSPPRSGCTLVLQDDGNLVLRDASGAQYWQSAPMTVSTVTLNPSVIMTPCTKVVSQDGAYELVYQFDGNLVVYRVQDGAALFVSDHNGAPLTLGEVRLSEGGRLFLVHRNGTVAWVLPPPDEYRYNVPLDQYPPGTWRSATLTVGDGDYYLTLHESGKIYWAVGPKGIEWPVPEGT